MELWVVSPDSNSSRLGWNKNDYIHGEERYKKRGVRPLTCISSGYKIFSAKSSCTFSGNW